MSGAEFGIALAVFLACAVEAVEALTIVLAVGVTRSWSAALVGAGTAVLGLALLIVGFGRALTLVPLAPLRIVVGALLLYYGAMWLRKAVLRHAGLKAKHDERAIFENEADSLYLRPGREIRGFDWVAFLTSFKGVALEGFEVLVIVLTLGAGYTAVAGGAAALAVVAVGAIGFAVRKPLARVPENAMKLAVGTMLVAFGAFWLLEGLGLRWPGGDIALLPIIVLVACCALEAASMLRRRQLAQPYIWGAGHQQDRWVAGGYTNSKEEAEAIAEAFLARGGPHVGFNEVVVEGEGSETYRH